MALTEAEIVNALLALGLPARDDVPVSYDPNGAALRRSQVARALLADVSAEVETKVRTLLASYAEVELDTDTIKAEGLDSSAARTRARIRGLLAQAIGFTTSGAGLGMRLVRG